MEFLKTALDYIPFSIYNETQNIFKMGYAV